MPAPMVRTANRSSPRPAPNQCSDSVSATTSLSTTAGRPVAAVSIAPSGTSVQPRNGADTTVLRSRVRPPTVTPMARRVGPVSYTHLRAHETRHDLVCRLLLEKKKKNEQRKKKKNKKKKKKKKNNHSIKNK